MKANTNTTTNLVLEKLMLFDRLDTSVFSCKASAKL